MSIQKDHATYKPTAEQVCQAMYNVSENQKRLVRHRSALYVWRVWQEKAR